MNIQKVVKMILRLFSVYLVFNFIVSLQSFFSSLFSTIGNFPPDQSNRVTFQLLFKAYYPVGLVWIVYLAMFIYLWNKSDAIAKRIVPESSNGNISATVEYNTESLIMVGFTVCGMFILVNALPQLVALVIFFAMGQLSVFSENVLFMYNTQQLVHVFTVILKLVLASFLILKSRKIAAKILRQQTK